MKRLRPVRASSLSRRSQLISVLDNMKNLRAIRHFLASTLLITFVGVGHAGKTFVAVPDVTWEILLPYVRASIVPQLNGTEFHVLVCQDQTDRTVVTPFDDGLADFAKVLVMQTLKTEPTLYDAIDAVTGAFRQRLSTLDPEARARYRDLFWQMLQDDPTVLPTIRTLFLSAREAKRLPCWPCQHDAAFAPAARRLPRADK